MTSPELAGKVFALTGSTRALFKVEVVMTDLVPAKLDGLLSEKEGEEEQIRVLRSRR
jgi:hypothetical protein